MSRGRPTPKTESKIDTDRASKKGPITVFLKSAKLKSCSFSLPKKLDGSRPRHFSIGGVNCQKPNFEKILPPLPLGVVVGVGPPLLGKLEHTLAKPFFGSKSVRLQHFWIWIGGIDSPRCPRFADMGPRAVRGQIPGFWVGGGGPMYAIVYPARHGAFCR